MRPFAKLMIYEDGFFFAMTKFRSRNQNKNFRNARKMRCLRMTKPCFNFMSSKKQHFYCIKLAEYSLSSNFLPTKPKPYCISCYRKQVLYIKCNQKFN